MRQKEGEMCNTKFPKPEEIPAGMAVTGTIEQNFTLLNGELLELDTVLQDVYSPISLNIPDKGLRQVRLGAYPLMNHQLAIEALGVAKRAFRSYEWKAKSVDYKISCAQIFLDEVVKSKDRIVKLLMWEIGKPLAECIAEFDRTLDYIRQTMLMLKKNHDAIAVEKSAGFAGKVMHTPVGVVVSSGPSNYPMYETYSLALPALLAGNCVLMKIPRYGALLHYYILEPLKNAFPKGVINAIYGKNEDTLNPIMRTAEINMLAYFGSSIFAEPLIFSHPRPYRLKKLLGLEAKNPAIVLNKVDLATTAKELVLGALAFNGQRCAAVKIIFADEKIHDELIELLRKEIENVKVGMPWEDGVRITPIFDRNRILYLRTLLDEAVRKGAKNETDNSDKNEGSLFYPALLSGVTPKMRIFNEEQFGPIVPVIKFSKMQEVLEMIADSEFGQQISIFGNDSAQIAELAAKLQFEAGRVNINTKCQRGPDIFPFTGRKNSGLGELSIADTLREFTNHTVIAGKENDCTEYVLKNTI